MRGASALQELLAARTGRKVRMLVVWTPSLPTDLGPPTTQVMSLVSDPRVRQFWDPEHVLSADLVRSFRSNPGKIGHTAEDFASPEFHVWDWVAVFGPQAQWGSTVPEPEFAGGIVVDVMPQVARSVDGVAPNAESR